MTDGNVQGETYPGVCERPTQPGNEGIVYDFNLGARMLLPKLKNPEVRWYAELYDAVTGNVYFSNYVEGGATLSSLKRYFVPFGFRVWIEHKGTRTLAFRHSFNAKGKRVVISFPVGTLGDTLAWMAAAVAFAKKHDCMLTCAMSEKIIPIFADAHPAIRFLTHEQMKVKQVAQQAYATYHLGLFFEDGDGVYQPCDFRHTGLHRTAAYILGVNPSEDPPASIVMAKRPIEEKYVCIATHGSTQAKMWNNPEGWHKVIAHLKEKGYRVICIDKQRVYGKHPVWNHIPNGAEDQTGDRSLAERLQWLQHAEFFIGLPSGLSWLAWIARIPVVLISGFSHPETEFITPYRVINWQVCNSCWNDPTQHFSHTDIMWCPRHEGTPRQFECTAHITGEQVISIMEPLTQ